MFGINSFVLLLASLVGQDESGNAAIPGIPDDLVQKWYSEDVFKKFHESLTEVYGAYDPTATPTKRMPPVQEGTPDEPSRKRGRVVGPESICRLEALTGQEISKAGAGEGPEFKFIFYVLTFSSELKSLCRVVSVAFIGSSYMNKLFTSFFP